MVLPDWRNHGQSLGTHGRECNYEFVWGLKVWKPMRLKAGSAGFSVLAGGWKLMSCFFSKNNNNSSSNNKKCLSRGQTTVSSFIRCQAELESRFCSCSDEGKLKVTWRMKSWIEALGRVNQRWGLELKTRTRVALESFWRLQTRRRLDPERLETWLDSRSKTRGAIFIFHFFSTGDICSTPLPQIHLRCAKRSSPRVASLPLSPSFTPSHSHHGKQQLKKLHYQVRYPGYGWLPEDAGAPQSKVCLKFVQQAATLQFTQDTERRSAGFYSASVHSHVIMWQFHVFTW